MNGKFRNKSCPCGKMDSQGKPIKYKKCCGKPGAKSNVLGQFINVNKINIEMLKQKEE
jgi:hypothetical protein